MTQEQFSFEKFRGVGSKLGSYTISISKNAAFGLNSGFYNAEKIKDFKYVTLFYDKNKRAIGFLFTNDRIKKDTFKISHGKNSGYIAARTFFLSIFPRNLNEFKKYVDRYTPKIYHDEKIGQLYYITLEEKEMIVKN
jgi:hypothetical protein